MESILTSIKKMLGITEEYEHFDADLIMHINSVLMILTQLGVGPSEGFRIEDELATWNEIIPADKNFEIIKSYMHLKVKLLFDPPLSSVVLGSMERMISEFEWRINILAEQMTYDPPKPTPDPTPSDKPVDDTKKFEVENVSVENHDVVMQFKGTAPKDVPTIETTLSDGNLYVTNNGNYDLNFYVSKNGILQVSDETNIPEEEPDVKEFTVNSVSIDEHSIAMDYDGEVPNDIPYLEANLSEGNIYVTNNGNYDLNFSLSKSGMIQVSDETGVPEEDFIVNSISIEDNSVVLNYEGDMPNDIPLLENSLTDGNMYVMNNGNYNIYLSQNNGLLQYDNGIQDDETFSVRNVSLTDGMVEVDYEGQYTETMPKLNTSFEEGTSYVNDNGNNNIMFTVNETKELEVNY